MWYYDDSYGDQIGTYEEAKQFCEKKKKVEVEEDE